VNQPLAAIAANATAGLRWLEHTPPNLDKATESMDLVIRDAQRAGDVIAHARALVKKSDGETSLVKVDQLIREVLRLVHSELQRHSVVVEEALAEDLLPVPGDRIRLQQLVLNLIMNGIEAMAEVTARPRRLVVSCGRGKGVSGSGILVGVQDAGVGAAAADLERLFDPFFTTKRDGLGMGLAIGRSIAQAHGGQLWARRNADHGLTFYLLIPGTGGGAEAS
jgi:C4-dicarboxylate-specific signal transduction histidine kinase